MGKTKSKKVSKRSSKTTEVTVKTLLAKHDHLTHVVEYNKVHCSITGRDVVASVEAIEAHHKSKVFKKAQWYTHDYSKYAPWLMDHGKDPKRLLFCTLTKKPVNKIPKDVEMHVNGKKFLRLKALTEEKIAKREAAKKDKELARLRRMEKLEAELSGSDEEEEQNVPVAAAEDSDSSAQEEVVISKKQKPKRVSKKGKTSDRKAKADKPKKSKRGTKRDRDSGDGDVQPKKKRSRK